MSTHREKSLTKLLIWGHEWGRCSSVTLAFVLCPSTATLVGGPNINDEGDVQWSESLVSLSGPSEDGFPDWSMVVTGASPQGGSQADFGPMSVLCFLRIVTCFHLENSETELLLSNSTTGQQACLHSYHLITKLTSSDEPSKGSHALCSVFIATDGGYKTSSG